MRSFRFLLSRRWLLFALAVVLIAWACWWLGGWQFGRLADRKASNAVIERNESLDPAPVADVLSTSRATTSADEWRLVTATGTYDTADTVLLRYATRDGESGVDVVVPLTTADGTSLLVDRGWTATANSGADTSDVPSPPTGQVTVTGWVRVDATDSTTVTDHSTRAISSSAIGEAIDMPVYRGFVDLKTEDPSPATALEPTELPELDNGPHFFYGLQWWFFGVLAVFGFFYLLYDEWRALQRGETSAAAEAMAERKKQRAAKQARKSAVRAAYQRAYAAERDAKAGTASEQPRADDHADDHADA